MHKRLLIVIILLLNIFCTFSQTIQLSDSSKISLLTNTPWDQEVYALFGHTAIRIQDRELDVVFNYGTFDFNSPNFMYRFIKGETDYMVVAYPFSHYIYNYQDKGIGITEQVLNLTQEEKQNLFDALVINSLPENRVYRYNYFYDNCSTRPRDIIEQNISYTIEYNKTDKDQTYRDLIHECVSQQPWVRFGIDLVIGADADKKLSNRQKDFLPLYLQNAYTGAKIKDQSGNFKSLVLQEIPVLKSTNNGTIKQPINTPLYVGIAILIITIAISYFSYIKNIVLAGKIFDTFFFLIAGLAGCIIFFLMFFSTHPCTIPNWNLVWLNPIQLIVALLFFIKFFSKYVYYYHFINFVLLIMFLLAWFLIPQHLEIAFLPYILALCVRSGTNIFQYKKQRIKI